jgi:autoinducer 2-degrading protein
VAASVEVPGRFFLYEKYTDDDAFFVKHREAEHYATFIARSTPLIVPGSKTVACAQPVAPRTETVPQ